MPFVFAFVLAWLPAHGQAASYTAQDTFEAIALASSDVGVSAAWLERVVGCETGQRFDPYTVGRQGELGAAQLHPHGLLRDFYADGYVDPFNPYEAVRFMAERFAVGQARAWSCR